MIFILRYFGLQVIHADKFNGGQSLVIDVNDIIDNLNEHELSILRSERFQFKIPPEFSKSDSKVSEGRILSQSRDKFDNLLFRYRRDIIMNRETMDPKLNSVLNSLESLIQIDESKIIKYHIMEDNDIMLMDNTRWLHGRTDIKDEDRHLLRIRFQAKYDDLLPIF